MKYVHYIHNSELHIRRGLHQMLIGKVHNWSRINDNKQFTFQLELGVVMAVPAEHLITMDK